MAAARNENAAMKKIKKFCQKVVELVIVNMQSAGMVVLNPLPFTFTLAFWCMFSVVLVT